MISSVSSLTSSAFSSSLFFITYLIFVFLLLFLQFQLILSWRWTAVIQSSLTCFQVNILKTQIKRFYYTACCQNSSLKGTFFSSSDSIPNKICTEQVMGMKCVCRLWGQNNTSVSSGGQPPPLGLVPRH